MLLPPLAVSGNVVLHRSCTTQTLHVCSSVVLNKKKKAAEFSFDIYFTTHQQ